MSAINVKIQDVSGQDISGDFAPDDLSPPYLLLTEAGSPGLPAAAIDRYASALEDDGSSIGLILSPESADLCWIWQYLPPGLASLAMPYSSECRLIVHAAALKRLQLRDVALPARDVLIRGALAGEATHLRWLPARSQVTVGPETFDVEEDLNVPVEDDLPDLAPSWPPRGRYWLADHLAEVRVKEQLPVMNSATDATALHAGLWQVHDFLDESHELAQSVQGQGRDSNGDYWHAIMHRREPDYGNSKYWFRRVGQHPVFAGLASSAQIVLQRCRSTAAGTWASRLGTPSDWDPFAFVDLCQAAARDDDSHLAAAARQIQWSEMVLLLGHCTYRSMKP